ncbi:VWA domain-containing protein [Flavobacterium kingsejongi]|uniref:VWA domain-containing protein n=2 Tax=Flavobacterium kingsejongi TaxID=1678728 RepID=A0A2S1LUQ8_9FLAO|nr:VWA domain-containing protein [Flavobacterium kingsejongi]
MAEETKPQKEATYTNYAPVMLEKATAVVEENTTAAPALAKKAAAPSTLMSRSTVTQDVIVKEISTNEITGIQTIKGTVTEGGLPLPGVSIAVVQANRGTQTDVDGNFTLQVQVGERMQFSYPGMKTTMLTVGENKEMDVALQADDQNLQEVVVMGYQKANRKTRKLAKARMEAMATPKRSNRAKQVKSDGTPTIITALAGKITGLTVTADTVQSGSTVLRAAGSQSQNQPLYIIDGVIINRRNLKKMNPEVIETITIVKSSEAEAHYGTTGKNGAIILTSKNAVFRNMTNREIRRKLRQLKKESPVSPLSAVENSEEEYDSFVENAFENPQNNPLSTFSIDVDNASYTNIRRFINNGQPVPKDAVRVEEMINFFKYNYPQPTGIHPFSITTEYSVAPWNIQHQIVRIGLQGKIIPTNELPASNFVFLIDVSGSMEDENKLPLLKASMKVLVDQLRKEDTVAIIVYAGAAGMVLPPTSGAAKQTIIAALDDLNAGGSTAGGAGIELAYKTAAEHFIKNGNNRVILATDGDFNVGSSSDKAMQSLIEEKRKSGVFLTCLGFGMGNYKDRKMELLSNKGNGNYAYIDNMQEANRFLGKEFKGSMFAIAKDVKIQIEFNPKHVQSYRLIGYENRKLRNEDFTDDAIDAGELGSGHTVTALYEIIPAGSNSPFGTSAIPLKYTDTKATAPHTDELATIKFRYKKPDGNKSTEIVQTIKNQSVPLQDASEDFRFSTAVAWFGLKLRDSEYVPNKNQQDIVALARKAKSHDPDGYKAEFIRLVETIE